MCVFASLLLPDTPSSPLRVQKPEYLLDPQGVMLETVFYGRELLSSICCTSNAEWSVTFGMGWDGGQQGSSGQEVCKLQWAPIFGTRIGGRFGSLCSLLGGGLELAFGAVGVEGQLCLIVAPSSVTGSCSLEG